MTLPASAPPRAELTGEKRMNWTLAEAAAFVAELSQWAKAEGYLLAIYGSVLAGNGRDLDLIAVPWRIGTTGALFVDALAARVHGQILEQGPGLLAQDSATIRIGARIVDIQVRRAVLEQP
jgi:hypothetical protein